MSAETAASQQIEFDRDFTKSDGQLRGNEEVAGKPGRGVDSRDGTAPCL